MTRTLLEVINLQTYFFTYHGVVRAVDGIDFCLFRGEALGLVGESGSGKTVTGLSILRLIQEPGKIVGGEIIFKSISLLDLSEEEIRNIRGCEISMIFQNPGTSLNPVLKISDQIDRIYRHHKKCSAKEAEERRLEMLHRVSIGDPKAFSDQYPHQISGGMCQRAMLVMALICKPELVIADEPTTGLDVTIQRQIMDLMDEMREQTQATQIIITHDLGVVAETCDRVVVMYASRIMEIATTQELFSNPVHPYTRGLLRSIPRIDVDQKPSVMPGNVPSALEHITGCPFHPRCSKAEEICRTDRPVLKLIDTGRHAACHFVGEG